MASLSWSLVCERAIIDTQSNQLSLISIIEQLNVPKVPVIAPQTLFIVGLWERTETTELPFKYRIKIKQRENEYVLGDNEFEAVIPTGKERLRILVAMNGLRIETTDDLSVIVEQQIGENWEGKSTNKVFIKLLAAINRGS